MLTDNMIVPESCWVYLFQYIQAKFSNGLRKSASFGPLISKERSLFLWLLLSGKACFAFGAY